MEVLFVFLKWVASFSYRDEETGSRMDMANLATVICPSILYAKGANAARDESFIGISAVQDLLENQNDYYFIPSDLAFVVNEGIYNIFAKELDLPPKEIHRHCSKYLQARGTAQSRGVAPGPGMPMGMPPGAPPQMPQMRERQSDPRLSVHRPEGTVSPSGEPMSYPNGGNGSGQFRQPPPPGQGTHSRPTSWAQQSLPGSQQNLHHAMNSPGNAPFRGGGLFQGSANGSRNSSRGSAPSSPGPDTDRRSFHMEREKSWQSVGQDHPDWAAGPRSDTKAKR